MSRKPRKTKVAPPPAETVERLQALAEAMGPEEFWAALEAVPILKRTRGRPKGTGRNWAPSLDRMADLICSGEVKGRGEAARAVATADPGHSLESTYRQLNAHFRKAEKDLLRRAEERRAARLKRLYPRRGKRIVFSRRTRFEEITEAVRLTEASPEFMNKFRAFLYRTDDDPPEEELGKMTVQFLRVAVGPSYWEDYNEVLDQAMEVYGRDFWVRFGGVVYAALLLAESYERLILSSPDENNPGI